jgi:hypothetical protein
MNIEDLIGNPIITSLVNRAALRRTLFGAGNIFRTEVRDGKAVIISNVTGKTYDSIDKALIGASSDAVTEMVTVTSAPTRRGDRYGAVAGILADFKQEMLSDPSQLQSNLQNLGIDLGGEDFRDVNINILFHKTREKGGIKNIANRLLEKVGKSDIFGMPIVDDEGVRLIQFVMNPNEEGRGVQLTESQSYRLLAMYERSLASTGALAKIFASSADADRKGGEILKILGKLGKRIRGDFSEREVSLAGENLVDFLGARSGFPKNPLSYDSLEKGTLFLDRQYEMMLKYYSGLSGRNFQRDLQNAYGTNSPVTDLVNFYSNQDANDLVGALKEKYGTQTTINDLDNWMASNIFRITKSSQFASDDLKAAMERAAESGDVSKETGELFKKIFAGIEYSDDGTALLNARHLRAYGKSVNREIKDLQNQISSGALDSTAAAAARDRIVSLKQLSGQVGQNGSVFDQITARGHVLGMTIKSAFRSVDFRGPLNKYVAILSKSDLKSEYGVAKELETLQLSGFGKYKETVYTDAVTAAFHGNIYTSAESMQAMRENAMEVLDEFQQVVRSGIVPQKIKDSIDMRASQEISDLPDYLRGSALRNREFAKELQRMLQSGVSPSNSPRMISRLYNYYSSQIFRKTEKGIDLAMPDVHRFALSSEANLLPHERSILGRGLETLSFGTGNTSADLMQFRIKGHTMMMSANAIDDFRASLGGFDLDDKGMPKLVTMQDAEGKERLGFFITRQPSGEQEYIVGRAKMEAETIRAIFGEDTRFGRKFVQELGSYSEYLEGLFPTPDQALINKAQRINALKTALTDPSAGVNLDVLGEGNIEQDIIQVLNRMEANRKIRLTRLSGDRLDKIVTQAAGAPLRITGELAEELGTPPTKRLGLFQLELDEEIQKNITKSTQDKIMAEVKSIHSKYTGLDSLTIEAIEEGNYEKFFQSVGTNLDPNIAAMINQVSGRLGLQRASSGEDILGVYINRTMAVGSTRNQIEDIARQMGDDFYGNISKYQIGLLMQETAIDLSTTLSIGGGKFSMSQVTSSIAAAIEGSSGMIRNSDQFRTALQEVLDSLETTGGMKIFREGAGIGEIGSQAIDYLSRQIGYTRAAVTEAGRQDLVPGIDRSILNRVVTQDASIMLQGYIQGLRDRQSTNQDVLQMINDAEQVMRSSNTDLIQETVRSLMSLEQGSAYETVSKINDYGTLADATGDALVRSLKMGATEDPSLAGLRISDESLTIARNIVEKHKYDIADAFMSESDDIKDFVGAEYAEMQRKRDLLSLRIFSEMNEAAANSQESLGSIADAIEYVDAFENKNLSFYEKLTRLTPIASDDIEDQAIADALGKIGKVYEVFQGRKQIRKDQYRASLASEATRNLHQQLKQSMAPGSALNESNLVKALKNIDAANPSSGENSVVAVIADMMAGKFDRAQETLGNDEIFGILQAETDSLRSLVRLDQIQQHQIPSSFQIYDDGLSQEELQRLYAPIMDREVKNVKYKRFREAIKSESFKEAFNAPLVKRSAYAIGALIAGSLMYTSGKDRSPDDMAGPPLLPGGSAYETGYPMRVPEIGTYNMGMRVDTRNTVSYKIQLMGDNRQIENARNAIANMNIGPVNTTIYNGLPRGNSDPLANFAASY